MFLTAVFPNDLLASNHKLLGKSFVCPVPLGSALMRKESEQSLHGRQSPVACGEYGMNDPRCWAPVGQNWCQMPGLYIASDHHDGKLHNSYPSRGDSRRMVMSSVPTREGEWWRSVTAAFPIAMNAFPGSV